MGYESDVCSIHIYYTVIHLWDGLEGTNTERQVTESDGKIRRSSDDDGTDKDVPS